MCAPECLNESTSVMIICNHYLSAELCELPRAIGLVVAHDSPNAELSRLLKCVATEGHALERRGRGTHE